MSPAWITAFLDVAPGHAGVEEFWAAATGCTVSAPRGERGEFATLQPARGDAYVRLQRLGAGSDRIHLDLHVGDPRVAADAAVALGASEVADLGHVVLRSPSGFAFCCVPDVGGHVRPAPQRWPDGHLSLVDQVCLDIPAAAYEREAGFWAALTGWERRASDLPEFGSLRRPGEQPLRLLLQRLGEDDPATTTRAHLDLATTDRRAEVARLVALGARAVGEGRTWTVLADPAGRPFCVTDREP
jgi:hypothetical protein